LLAPHQAKSGSPGGQQSGLKESGSKLPHSKTLEKRTCRMPSENDLAGFTPGLRLRIEAKEYVIKTADSFEEVKQALRLRYDVFYGEYLQRTNPQQLDLDRFDSICDHMLVVETGTGRVVGTYRLNSSRAADYYARQEFDIDTILRLEGDKLEVGRGCVAKRCRKLGVFMMLWKGIAEYMHRSGARYLFGCASLPARADIERVAALYGYLLRQHYSSDERRVCPLKLLPARQALVCNRQQPSVREEAASRRLLPLLSFYLHAGAVVCGEPAYDEDFQTYDFFTLLDLEALTNAGNKLFRTPDHGSFDSVKAFMRE
jgi:putative hemolysin